MRSRALALASHTSSAVSALNAVVMAVALAVTLCCSGSGRGGHVAARVPAGDWTELLVVDCNSVAHVLPSQPLLSASVDVTHVRQLIEYVQSAVKARAKCHCPALSDADIDARFGGDAVGTLLRWAQPKPSPNEQPPYESACQTSLATKFYADALAVGDPIDVALPNTCTVARWEAGQGCTATYAFGQSSSASGGNAEVSKINVFVDKCPAGTPSASQSDGKGLPYVSVTCSGPRCADWARLCQSDADCGAGAVCASPFGWSHASTSHWLANLMRSYGLYGDDATCAGVDAATDAPGEWALQKLLSQWVTDLWGGIGSVSADRALADLRVCGGGIDFTRAGNDFNRCTVSNAVNGTRSVDCALSPWDGALPSGEAANSAARKSGAGRRALPTAASVGTPSGAVHVASLTCDNQMAALLSDGSAHWRAAGPQAQRIVQSALGVVQDIASSRTIRGAAYSSLPPVSAPNGDQFDARFSPASLTGGLALATVHDAFDLGSQTWDLYHYFASRYGVATTGDATLLGPLGPVDASRFAQLRVPSGCTLSDWLRTGRCSFAFDGFNSLFTGFEATVRVDIKRCGNGDNNALPNSMSALVDCVGADCNALLEPWRMTYCTQDSDCPAPANANQPPARCNSIGPLVSSLGAFISPLTGGQQLPFLKRMWTKTTSYSWVTLGLRPPSAGYFVGQSQAQLNQYLSDGQYLALLANALNDFNANAGCYQPAFDGPCTNVTAAVFVIDATQTFVQTDNGDSSLTFVVNVMPGRSPATDTYTPVHIASTLAAGYSYGASGPFSAPLWTAAFPLAPITPFYGLSSYAPRWGQATLCASTGQYVVDPTACPTYAQDTCDDWPHYEADVLQFLRVLSGQSPVTNINTSPTGVRGYCTLATTNAASAYGWSNTLLTTATDPTTSVPVRTLNGLKEYHACANSGDTCDPNVSAGAPPLQPTAAVVLLHLAAAVISAIVAADKYV